MSLPSSIDESVLQQRLLELAAAKNWEPRLLSTLETFIRTADDYDLFRINPLQYGGTAGLSDADAIELFVHAAKIGLFELDWQLLCAYCPQIAGSFRELDKVHPRFQCEFCNALNDVALDDYIQITFTVSEKVRDNIFRHPEKLSVEDYYLRYHFAKGFKPPHGMTPEQIVALLSRQFADFETVIERALGIACDTLIPRGLDASWRDLSLVERYCLRALDIESRGERRKGMYEELARGFGVTDIKPLLKSDKANGTRVHTASGFAAAGLASLSGGDNTDGLPARRGRASAGAPHPFAASPLRHLLFATRETSAADKSPEPGRQYLRDTFGQGYWTDRERFIGLLEWLAALGNAEGMNEWIADSEAARILAGRLRNDHA